MELLLEPQVWLSFVALALLEIVLGIDNVIFLTILVERLPAPQRRSARIAGLAFAMLTRIGLLATVNWLATLRRPLAGAGGFPITVRSLILFVGGAFLVVKSVLEIREQLRGAAKPRTAGRAGAFWLVVAQIGIIDIVFSVDSVFAAVGLANSFAVMAAAIVAAVGAMMWLAGAIGAFIGRHPSLKTLALAFMVLVGGALIGQAFGADIPKAYLYFAMAFSAVVEWINIRIRRRGVPAP
jgi:predicted tellurium resistance membrane protein TerC